MRTHCKHGHEFTVENTYLTKQGKRVCRVCGRLRSAAARRSRWVGVAVIGQSHRTIGALKAQERRLELYGKSRLPAESLERMRTKLKHHVKRYGNQNTFKQKCKHGHSLADAYVYWRVDGTIRNRQCRMCARLAKIKIRDLNRKKLDSTYRQELERKFVEVQHTLQRSHPDLGGSGGRLFKRSLSRFRKLKKQLAA